MRTVTSFVMLTGISAFAVCAAQAPATSSAGPNAPPRGGPATVSSASQIPSPPSQAKPIALQSTSSTSEITISKPKITFAAPRAAPTMTPKTVAEQVTVRSAKPEYHKGPWHIVLHGQDYYCRLEATGSHVESTPVCLTKRQLQNEDVQTQQFFESFYRNGAAEQAVTKSTMSTGGGAVAGP